MKKDHKHRQKQMVCARTRSFVFILHRWYLLSFDLHLFRHYLETSIQTLTSLVEFSPSPLALLSNSQDERFADENLPFN